MIMNFIVLFFCLFFPLVNCDASSYKIHGDCCCGEEGHAFKETKPSQKPESSIPDVDLKLPGHPKEVTWSGVFSGDLISSSISAILCTGVLLGTGLFTVYPTGAAPGYMGGGGTGYSNFTYPLFFQKYSITETNSIAPFTFSTPTMHRISFS